MLERRAADLVDVIGRRVLPPERSRRGIAPRLASFCDALLDAPTSRADVLTLDGEDAACCGRSVIPAD